MADTPERRGAAFPARLPGAPAASPREPLRPQRLLHEAAQDARRQAPTSGLGLDSAAVRERMVQRLRAQGLVSEPVCQALRAVPRHEFVDSALANQAYEDTSLPIGAQQTISKPSVVARMLSLALAGRTASRRGHLGRVLEVGTGCGYQTALLSLLAHRVVSLERLELLHLRAQANLQAWPHRNLLRLMHGDGMAGAPGEGPFDTIVAAAGGDELPSSWARQLADGGRIVAPVSTALGAGQTLCVVDRHGDELHRTLHEGVHFVPLRSGIA